MILKIWRGQGGMASLSALIVLCIIGMTALYFCRIAAEQADSILSYKESMAAKNFAISRAEYLTDAYRRDLERWQGDCEKAYRAYSFDNALLVDESKSYSDFGEMTSYAHLMRHGDDLYILSVSAESGSASGQVRLYLKQEGGDVVVQRWER